MPKYALPPGASWYPQYLPYPHAIPAVSNYPVPNATAINMPQGQFAPPFLPPGSRSFQPYNYAQGVTTKVLEGSGNPYDTKTPMAGVSYGGDSHGDCGCSGYAGDDEKSENLSAWGYIAFGAAAALVLKHLIDKARQDPGIYD